MLLIVLLLTQAPLPIKGDYHDWTLGDVHALAWASDSSAVIAGTASGEIVVWNARTGRVMARWKADKGLVALSLRGEVLVSGSERGQVQLWLWRTGKPVRAFRTVAPLRSLCLHPDGKSLATASEGLASRWDVLQGKEMATYTDFATNGPACCVAHAPDGKQLLISGEYRKAGGWQGAWCVRWTLDPEDEPLGGGGGATKNPPPIWNTRRLGHCIAWSPDSQYAYYPGADTLYRSTHQGGSGAATCRGYPVGLSYSPDGKSLYYADFAGIVRKLDGRTLQEQAKTDDLGPITHFALSPDGKTYVVANKRKVMLRLVPKESPR
jgi:WD40 repeat protein